MRCFTVDAISTLCTEEIHFPGTEKGLLGMHDSTVVCNPRAQNLVSGAPRDCLTYSFKEFKDE